MCQFKTALTSAPAGAGGCGGACRCQAGALASAPAGVEPLRQVPPELLMLEKYFAQPRCPAVGCHQVPVEEDSSDASSPCSTPPAELEEVPEKEDVSCQPCQADRNNNSTKTAVAAVASTSRLRTAKSLPCQRRRVQFADDLGQSLIEVRLFESEPHLFAPVAPQFLDLLLQCQFEQPSAELALRALMKDACNVKLSGLRLDPVSAGRVSLTGYAIVKNISFKKRVFVRITADSWRSFADLEADYAGSMDELRDAFEFELRCEIEEVDFEFCVCFEAEGLGQLWDSNDGANYKASLVKPRRATFSLWDDEEEAE